MTATLIKKYEVYMLLYSNIIIASSDENFNGVFYLSKQNCDEIFGVIDKEIEIEIEMESVEEQVSHGATFIPDSDCVLVTQIPKLDSEGCLILKQQEQ